MEELCSKRKEYTHIPKNQPTYLPIYQDNSPQPKLEYVLMMMDKWIYKEDIKVSP